MSDYEQIPNVMVIRALDAFILEGMCFFVDENVIVHLFINKCK